MEGVGNEGADQDKKQRQEKEMLKRIQADSRGLNRLFVGFLNWQWTSFLLQRVTMK